MKFSVLLAAVASAALSSAVAVPDVDPTPVACAPDPAHTFPACAASCMATAVKAAGCTGITDYACQCKNFATLHTSAGPCIDTACGAQAADVASAAQALCATCT